MLEKLFRNRPLLAVLAGVTCGIACPTLTWLPFMFVFPLFLNPLTFRCPTFKSGALWGFLTSVIIMIVVFYWVTVVIHEFGYLPWSISVLLFAGFCLIGALNFALFTGLCAVIHSRVDFRKVSPTLTSLWFALGIPALFTICEWLIPKLFPWYICHIFYRHPELTQMAEITGCTFLSFTMYSFSSFLSLFLLNRTDGFKINKWVGVIPLALIVVNLSFSYLRLHETPPPSHTLRFALIQPNIGSLEKVEAEKGIGRRVMYVIERYRFLTEEALKKQPNTDIILWPETAIPFQMEGGGQYSLYVKKLVERWGVKVIAGAYAPDHSDPSLDYNAAYLLDPKVPGVISDVYYKNVLLAFGEYMPLGETFPSLYRYFPQVSRFGRGTTQKPFILADGTRLGITICYEAILPSFVRKTAASQINALINLTNDSWFGPTGEPEQHGALAVFRAIEHRVPIARVTNTGTSFTVDDRGRMGPQTGVYAEGILFAELKLPITPPQTFYQNYGDWFIIVAFLLLASLTKFLFKTTYAPLSI